jgi:hypothetical protein
MWAMQDKGVCIFEGEDLAKNIRVEGKDASLGWKEILIKAFARAIPTFVMGCFDLTKDMCDLISTMIGRYWCRN